MLPSKALLFFCLSFIGGILIGSVWSVPPLILWGFFIASGISLVVSFFMPKRYLAIVACCMLCGVLGVTRFQAAAFSAANDPLIRLQGTGPVTLTGVVVREPDVRATNQQLVVNVHGSYILLTAPGYPAYSYQDVLEITGKLEEPMENPDFSYKEYLLKDRIYSVMAFPKITVRGNKQNRSPLSFFYGKVLDFKKGMRQTLGQYFFPPESDILTGTVLGDRAAISPEFKAKLNVTGLSHVIAVSGGHIVLLTAFLMPLCLALGLWRQQAFYVVSVSVVLYVVLVGMPASAVRAGIMALLVLLGQQWGRQATGSRLLVFAASGMLMMNPFLLRYDIGFQLSFLAVLGLIYADPLLKKGIGLLLPDQQGQMMAMFSATLSAQLFTLPILAYNFGNISLIAPLTNLLVLPVVPPLMILGFFAGVAGMIWAGLGWALSVPCYILLYYFTWVIKTFAQPWAFLTYHISIWWMVLLYLGLAYATFWLHQKYIRFI